MGKKNQKLAVLVALVVASTFTGCSNKTAVQNKKVAEVKQANATEEKKYVSHLTENGEGIAIVREKGDWTNMDGRKEPLMELPESVGEYKLIDLRTCDVSQLDLTNEIENLKCASFDSKTKWPNANKMPADFDPEKIMEEGKNPGLGIGALHEQGITGKGVGIAIIGQPLLADHDEYKDNLKLYEEIDVANTYDKVENEDGSAVASLAVGKTCGVAKDADLYYIGNTKSGYDVVCTNVCKCIDRILEINEKLPANKKIRVITIPGYFCPEYKDEYKDFDKLDAKVKEVEDKGIFVLTFDQSGSHKDAENGGLVLTIANTFKSHDNIHFGGLNRLFLKDVDDASTYYPDFWLTTDYIFCGEPTLWLPMGNRAFASCQGQNLYEYNWKGSPDWMVSYFAGCYALACQVYPQITPNQFFELAIKTGDILNDTPENTRKDKENARIINMAKLIEELKKL